MIGANSNKHQDDSYSRLVRQFSSGHPATASIISEYATSLACSTSGRGCAPGHHVRHFSSGRHRHPQHFAGPVQSGEDVGSVAHKDAEQAHQHQIPVTACVYIQSTLETCELGIRKTAAMSHLK
eukprot:scaffold186401_cov35-Prasinocladus_malaysianus.AAC.2